MPAELQGGDPQGSVTEEALAPQLVAPSTGQAFTAAAAQAFSTSPGVGSARFAARQQAAGQTASPLTAVGLPSLIDQAAPDAQSGITPAPPEADVPKDQLNKQFGIPGVLSFDKDMPASIAQDLHDHHVAEIQRADVLQRAAQGTPLGGVAQFVGGFAGSLLDPLNIAASFVPGVPEAKVAGMLGDTALGAGGRLAVRAATGATQGAAGALALQPLQYAVDKAQGDDWDMGTALSSIMYGGLIGGVIHPGLGIIEDAHGLPDWAGSVAQQPRELQEAATRGAIASVTDDRPVQAADAFDINTKLREAEQPFKFDVPPEANPTEAAVTQQLGAYADRLGVKLDPDEALTMARTITEAAPEQADAAGQAVLQDIQSRSDPVAAATADNPRLQAQDTAQQMAADQQKSVADPAIEQAQRDAVARATTAPNPTGDPVKDLTLVQQHAQDFNAYVQQAKALGNWTDADDAHLSRIAETEALGDGEAKAYARAAACLVGGVTADA